MSWYLEIRSLEYTNTLNSNCRYLQQRVASASEIRRRSYNRYDSTEEYIDLPSHVANIVRVLCCIGCKETHGGKKDYGVYICLAMGNRHPRLSGG